MPLMPLRIAPSPVVSVPARHALEDASRPAEGVVHLVQLQSHAQIHNTSMVSRVSVCVKCINKAKKPTVRDAFSSCSRWPFRLVMIPVPMSSAIRKAEARNHGSAASVCLSETRKNHVRVSFANRNESSRRFPDESRRALLSRSFWR